MTTSPAEMEVIAHKAAEKAIDGWFERMGIDTNDPRAMQKDLAYLRARRELEERISGRVVAILVTSFVVSVLGAVGLGLRSLLNSWPSH